MLRSLERISNVGHSREFYITHIHRSIGVIHAKPHNLVVVHQNTAHRGFVQLDSLLPLLELV